MGIGALKTDKQKEKDGVSFDIDGDTVVLRRAGNYNIAFENAMDEIMKPYRYQIQHGLLAKEKAQELEALAYARTVVADWTRHDEETGEVLDIPCTEENVHSEMMENPEFFAVVKRESNNAGNYRKDRQEEDAGNSQSSSGGNSSGGRKQKTSEKSSLEKPNAASA